MATKAPEKNVTPAAPQSASTASAIAPATLPGNLGQLAVPVASAGFSFKDFENPDLGESFGGTYTPIEIPELGVSNLLKYVKNTKLNLVDDGVTKILTVPVCEEIVTGKLVAMPLGAVFNKHWDDAKIQKGDTLIIGRYPNKIKKTGKGAGSTIMQIFGLKVMSRVSPQKELTAPAV